MKKITLLAVVALFTTNIFAQNVLSLRGALSKQFETGSITFFGPGASFQHGLTENIAVGLNFDYLLGESSTSSMNIEPRVDYFFNSVFNGFHVGSNIGFNTFNTAETSYSVGGMTITIPSTSSKALQLGAGLGYTHPLSENLLIDVTCGAGLGMSLETGGGSNFGVRPALSLGYKF